MQHNKLLAILTSMILTGMTYANGIKSMQPVVAGRTVFVNATEDPNQNGQALLQAITLANQLSPTAKKPAMIVLDTGSYKIPHQAHDISIRNMIIGSTDFKTVTVLLTENTFDLYNAELDHLIIINSSEVSPLIKMNAVSENSVKLISDFLGTPKHLLPGEGVDIGSGSNMHLDIVNSQFFTAGSVLNIEPHSDGVNVNIAYSALLGEFKPNNEQGVINIGSQSKISTYIVDTGIQSASANPIFSVGNGVELSKLKINYVQFNDLQPRQLSNNSSLFSFSPGVTGSILIDNSQIDKLVFNRSDYNQSGLSLEITNAFMPGCIFQGDVGGGGLYLNNVGISDNQISHVFGHCADDYTLEGKQPVSCRF